MRTLTIYTAKLILDGMVRAGDATKADGYPTTPVRHEVQYKSEGILLPSRRYKEFCHSKHNRSKNRPGSGSIEIRLAEVSKDWMPDEKTDNDDRQVPTIKFPATNGRMV